MKEFLTVQMMNGRWPYWIRKIASNIVWRMHKRRDI